MKIQDNEICFDCNSDEIVINPNNTKRIEYWCCNCKDITSTEIKDYPISSLKESRQDDEE
tara:strand:+ start:318 stop:497 length:180 start_codon:yes stop_codon:yes gene_type:complete